MPEFHRLIREFPAQRQLAFTVSGPFGDGRPLLLPLVLQLRGDRGHTPMAAKDVPPAILRETCLSGQTAIARPPMASTGEISA